MPLALIRPALAVLVDRTGGEDLAKPGRPGNGKEPRMPASRSTRANARPASKRAASLETLRLIAPTAVQAQKIAESFGLDPVDGDGIKRLHHDLLAETADVLKDTLNERSLQIHLQRLVAAFVGSATSSSQFYSRTVTDARDATSSMFNDERDEDREGPAGFDSRGQRKREFAAEAALQAFTLAMAAEGAASAYAAILGETWKPYERPSEPGAKLARIAGKMQMDAFS